jgi:hypothetical protein
MFIRIRIRTFCFACVRGNAVGARTQVDATRGSVPARERVWRVRGRVCGSAGLGRWCLCLFGCEGGCGWGCVGVCVCVCVGTDTTGAHACLHTRTPTHASAHMPDTLARRHAPTCGVHLCPRTHSAPAHTRARPHPRPSHPAHLLPALPAGVPGSQRIRTAPPPDQHADRLVVSGRAYPGPNRRPPGTDPPLPRPSAAPGPPTGSPKVLGDPARVLSRLRPLARSQRWGGPRTYPGPVHCLGRPLVVSCVRFSGVPSPPHAARM